MIAETRDGFVVSLHVQPRAKRTGIAGTHGEALKLRVAAPPVDNAANKACIAFFAKHLGVPKNRIEILTGYTSRTKRLGITCHLTDPGRERIKQILTGLGK